MVSIALWRSVRNAIFSVISFWVLLFAAYLALGQQLWPQVEQLKPQLEMWLSDRFSTPVEIGSLSGEWVRFNPLLRLDNVTLGDSVTFSQVTLVPSLYQSIMRGGLSFLRFDVENFSAELVETSAGWRLVGLHNSNAEGALNLRGLLALLRRQEEVRFSNTRLNFRPLQRPALVLTMEEGRLASLNNSNGLVASASLAADGLTVPVELQLETTREAGGVHRLYLKHGDFELAPWVNNLYPQISSAIWAGEYWINLVADDWQSLTLRLRGQQVSYRGEHHQLAMQDALVEGYVENSPQGVEAWLNLLEYQLNGREHGSTQLRLSQQASGTRLHWDAVPASLIGDWLALNDSSGFWQGIGLDGYIEQGSLWLAPGEEPRLQAEVSQLSLRSYQSVPGMDRLSGQLELAAGSGELRLAAASSQLVLPEIYTQPLALRAADLSLRWRRAPDYGLFTESTAALELQRPGALDSESAISATLGWRAILPNDNQQQLGREASFALQIEVPMLNRDAALWLADNRLTDAQAYALIDQNLLAGEFSDLSLHYLTPLSGPAAGRGQVFLRADFGGAELSFLDGWDSLVDLQGQFALTNQGIALQAAGGRYRAVEIPTIVAEVDYDAEVFKVNAALEAKAEVALDFLKAGPLRASYDAVFDSWTTAGGQVTGELALTLPLPEPALPVIRVRAELQAVPLRIADIDMQFDDVSGVIGFHSNSGIWSEDLQVTHQGLVQQVYVRSELEPENPVVLISANGTTPLSYWGARLQDPWLARQTALLQHRTQIRISPQQTLIDTQSDGVGLALDLPAPLTKAAAEPMPLTARLRFDQRGWLTLQTTVGEELVNYMEFDQNGFLQRGTLAYATPLEVREETGFYIDLNVNAANVDEWWLYLEKVQRLHDDFFANRPPDKPTVDTLIRSIQLTANQLDYMAQPWSAVNLSVLRNAEGWLAEFDSAEGKGQLLIPHQEGPLFVDLEWLSLTTPEAEIDFAEQVDPLQAYLPSQAPAMQVQVNKLIWNNRDLGSWRAVISHEGDALVASELIGKIAGAELRGELVWSVAEDATMSTQFSGNLVLADVLDVLNTLNYAPVLNSQSGRLEADFQWAGSPAFFDLRRLNGSLDLQLARGSILQIEEYQGVKLIGLLNMTRLIRRLALDFSDVLQAGISFDEIDGTLLFADGLMKTEDELAVSGSAIKFRFNGDVDLVQETIDMDTVVTVPLSTTLPLVALLAGLSPQAAAAIYVTERVFNNELERLSSARVKLSGPLEEPTTEFYRAFSTASRREPELDDANLEQPVE